MPNMAEIERRVVNSAALDKIVTEWAKSGEGYDGLRKRVHKAVDDGSLQLKEER
jgi:hypothetical protein